MQITMKWKKQLLLLALLITGVLLIIAEYELYAKQLRSTNLDEGEDLSCNHVM